MATGSLSTNKHKLDSKSYDIWYIQMEATFGFQDILKIVTEGFVELTAEPTEAERATYIENKRKDCKRKYLIHQGCDESNFDKIRNAKTSIEAWDILQTSFVGDAKVKKVKLNAMRKQYENTR